MKLRRVPRILGPPYRGGCRKWEQPGGIELDLEHGSVRQDGLLVRHEHGRLHAEVRDDGRGFDPANRSSHDTGIASLRSRAVRPGG